MSQTGKKLVTVGVIMGAHGVRGDLRVKSFTDTPEAIFSYGPLLSKSGDILLAPKSFRPAKTHFIVTPKSPRQKEAWDSLKGTELCIARTSLPNTETDEFYITDLIGLEVRGDKDRVVGTVKAVLNHGAGDLIEVIPCDGGKSVFIPFTQTDVPQINLAGGFVRTTSFDLWADETAEQREP